MPENQTPETVPVYRVENPTIPASPDGITSHEDLVGQWFTPDIDTAITYLRKSTQTFGKGAGPINGAQLVVAQVPAGQLEAHHVSRNPTAAGMDVESNNYLIPRDGSVPTEVIPLDDTLGELRGQLGNLNKLTEAKQRVYAAVGYVAVEK